MTTENDQNILEAEKLTLSTSRKEEEE